MSTIYILYIYFRSLRRLLWTIGGAGSSMLIPDVMPKQCGVSNRTRWPAVGWVAISVAQRAMPLCQSWQASGSARPNFISKCSSNPSCFGPVSRSHLQGANVGDGTALGASRKLTSTGRDTPRCVSEYPHTKTSMHILALDLYRRILDTMDTAVLRIPLYVHSW